MRVPCPHCGGQLTSTGQIKPIGSFVARVATCACGVTAMIVRNSETGKPFVASFSGVPLTVQVVH